MAGLLVVAVIVYSFGLVSGRLERTPVTAPMVFVAAGTALGASGVELGDVELDAGAVGVLAEATLVLLLFTDAIRIDLSRLRRDGAIAVRMLGIGLPLTVAAGTAVGWLLRPDLGWAGALVLAAVLAPTDAALGGPVVSDRRLPVRIRQSVNVESGLNDGLALPIVTIAAAVAVGERTTATDIGAALAEEIGFGVVVGVVIGFLGGRLLDVAVRRGLVTGVYRQLATLSLGVAAFAAAEALGGNGFVAAFVGGLGFGAAARDHCDGAYDFAEDEGVLLAHLTFLVFGAVLVADAIARPPDAATIAYAVASLTVVRMVPVGISLLGSGLRPPTIAFLGWFGPRGLASVLFTVFVIEKAGPASEGLVDIVTWVVLLSVVVHGLTARPLSERFARWSAVMPSDSPEMGAMEEFPLRGG